MRFARGDGPAGMRRIRCGAWHAAATYRAATRCRRPQTPCTRGAPSHLHGGGRGCGVSRRTAGGARRRLALAAVRVRRRPKGDRCCGDSLPLTGCCKTLEARDLLRRHTTGDLDWVSHLAQKTLGTTAHILLSQIAQLRTAARDAAPRGARDCAASGALRPGERQCRPRQRCCWRLQSHR